jgi:hypothetical protein
MAYCALSLTTGRPDRPSLSDTSLIRRDHSERQVADDNSTDGKAKRDCRDGQRAGAITVQMRSIFQRQGCLRPRRVPGAIRHHTYAEKSKMFLFSLLVARMNGNSLVMVSASQSRRRTAEPPADCSNPTGSSTQIERIGAPCRMKMRTLMSLKYHVLDSVVAWIVEFPLG